MVVTVKRAIIIMVKPSNRSMRHIPIKQLKLIRLLIIAFSTNYLIGYIFIRVFRHAPPAGRSAFTLELASMVVFQLFYELIVQLFFLKKWPVVLTLVTLGFATLEVLIACEPTGFYHSPYVIALYGLIFLAGVYGQYPGIGILFIIFLGYILSVTGLLKFNGNAIGGIFHLIFGSIAAISGYLIWGKYYEAEPVSVSLLNAMIKSGSTQTAVIIRSIADGVIVFDKFFRINLINQPASDISEWPVNEALGLDIHMVMKLTPSKDTNTRKSNTDYFAEVLKNNQPISAEFSMTGRKNKNTSVQLTISPIAIEESPDPVGAIAVFRDVTQTKQVEQQRADFISTASHEMRTPVAAIEGYLSLAMNEKVSNIDSKAREYLDKAYTSTRQLSKLFQDLLTSSKAEDGRLTNHPVVVEFSNFVKEMSDSFQLVAQKKNLIVDYVINTDSDEAATVGKVVKPLFYVQVDPDRMREVITNLFDNAMKYTEAGKIVMGISATAQTVQFTIKDSGLGIPEEDIPHLFQKFYRVDNSAVRTIGGAGLGLFICRKIVELYNGRIWVESELGKGSTFHIDLPRLSTEQAEALKLNQEADASLGSASLPVGQT